MNTRFLETLVWLARLRSFGRTADKLNTTQPAVSSRIGKLEELLGVRLYDRQARQFELTPAGRRVLRYAEEIVKLSFSMREAAASDQNLEVDCRVGVIEIVTLSWLPQFVETVVAAFPQAILDVGTGTSQSLIEQLRNDERDIVFVIGPVNEPHILSRPLGSVEMAWVANPAYFDCDTKLDVVELSRLPVVFQKQNASGYDLMVEYFRSYGVHNVPSHDGKMTIDCVYSAGTAAQVVRSGLGIMGLPLFLVKDDIAAGRVKVMNITQRLSPFYVTACCKQPVTNHQVSWLIDAASEAATAFSDATHGDLPSIDRPSASAQSDNVL